MEEVWKDVIGWEGIYRVSSFGKIKSLSKPYSGSDRNGKPLIKRTKERYPTIFKNRKGYLNVYLNFQGKSTYKLIHRLVAEAFNLKFAKDLQIDHIDMDKENNNASNLDCVTLVENMKRSHRYGSHKRRHGMPVLKTRKLTIGQVSLIKEMYNCEANKIKYGKPFEQRWLAKCFKCSQNTIMKIVNNKSCYDN